MRVEQITKDQYTELCCNGALHSAYTSIYKIDVLTWHKKIAIKHQADDTFEIIKLLVV